MAKTLENTVAYVDVNLFVFRFVLSYVTELAVPLRPAVDYETSRKWASHGEISSHFVHQRRANVVGDSVGKYGVTRREYIFFSICR